LYGEFTIQEAMEYFGRIYGMTAPQIEEKMTFLIKFLDLPSANRIIQTLRYDQKKTIPSNQLINNFLPTVVVNKDEFHLLSHFYMTQNC